jgi:hypothetical protein
MGVQGGGQGVSEPRAHAYRRGGGRDQPALAEFRGRGVLLLDESARREWKYLAACREEELYMRTGSDFTRILSRPARAWSRSSFMGCIFRPSR